MTGRVGANGRIWTPHGVASLSGGHGVYDVRLVEGGHAGDRVDTLRRRRHTYRTAYRGTRIGYDRTHTCWEARDHFAVRCLPTLHEAVEGLLRVVREGVAGG